MIWNVSLNTGVMGLSTGVCTSLGGLRRAVSYLWGSRFCAGTVDKPIVQQGRQWALKLSRASCRTAFSRQRLFGHSSPQASHQARREPGSG